MLLIGWLIARKLRSLVCPAKSPKGNPLPERLHQVLPKELVEGRRVLIVGDLHGCFDELQDLLSRCGYRPGQDVVVSVGDLVNKGPDSLAVLRWFAEGGPLVRAVRGNHEEAALANYRNLKAGQAPKNERFEWLQQVDAELAAYLGQLPLTLRLPSHRVIVVHAGLVPGVPLGRQHILDMITMRNCVAIEEASSEHAPIADGSSSTGAAPAAAGEAAQAQARAAALEAAGIPLSGSLSSLDLDGFELVATASIGARGTGSSGTGTGGSGASSTSGKSVGSSSAGAGSRGAEGSRSASAGSDSKSSGGERSGRGGGNASSQGGSRSSSSSARSSRGTKFWYAGNRLPHSQMQAQSEGLDWRQALLAYAQLGGSRGATSNPKQQQAAGAENAAPMQQQQAAGRGGQAPAAAAGQPAGGHAAAAAQEAPPNAQRSASGRQPRLVGTDKHTLGVPWSRAWSEFQRAAPERHSWMTFGCKHAVFGHDARRLLQLERCATGLDGGVVYGNTLYCLLLPPLDEDGQPLLDEAGAPPDAQQIRLCTGLPAFVVGVPARQAYAPTS